MDVRHGPHCNLLRPIHIARRRGIEAEMKTHNERESKVSRVPLHIRQGWHHALNLPQKYAPKVEVSLWI